MLPSTPIPGHVDRVERCGLLVVDDDEDLLASLGDFCEVEGRFQVRTARDHRSAVAVAQEFSPAVSLVDVKLENSCGLDLVAELKETLPHLVCIVMTGYQELENVIEALRCGADDYLRKPIEPIHLMRVLQRHRERQFSRQKRRQCQEHRCLAFDHCSQALFVLDSRGSTVEVNEAALQLCEAARGEVLHRRLWEAPLWRSSREVAREVRKATEKARAGDCVCLEVTLRTPAGRRLTLDLSLKPVRDDGGRVIRVISEARDMTGRKLAELALKDATSELKRRIAQGSAALERVRGEVEQARRERNEFFVRTSHRLRTPLNAIMGFSELLQLHDNSLSAFQRGAVGGILAAGIQLLEFIEQEQAAVGDEAPRREDGPKEDEPKQNEPKHIELEEGATVGEAPGQSRCGKTAPAGDVRQGTVSSGEAVEAAAGTVHAIPRPLRVLVADDSAVNRQVASLMLDQLGCRRKAVGNGLEVLEALAKSTYDVVLMDVQMPELDGLSTTRYIRRKLPARSQPRIVALTASAQPDQRERCLQAGMNTYLQKPLRMAALKACLEGMARGAWEEPRNDVAEGTCVLDRERVWTVLKLEKENRAQWGSPLVHTFLKSATEKMASLSRALRDGDPEVFARAAHALGGSSVNLGAMRLGALCMEAEKLTRQGDRDELERIVARIGDEWEQVKRELTRMVNELYSSN